MFRKLIPILIPLLVFICILCIRGPQGPAGEKGESDTVYVFGHDTIYIAKDTVYCSCHDSATGPPVAHFTVTPESGNIATSFSLDASDSYDSLRFLLYRWDWESDGNPTKWTTDPAASHKYANIGTKTITLEVLNIKGLKDSTVKPVVVVNTRPKAAFSVKPVNGDTGTVFTFDASACTDREDTAASLAVSWQWETGGPWTGFSTVKTANHKYGTSGDKSVTLVVTDSEGGTDSLTKVVPVKIRFDTLYDARDGRTYVTVLIDTQVWMAENLNIGTVVQSGNDQGNNGVIEKYAYNNDPAMGDTFGGLYQWDEMMQYSTLEQAQGICPDGWHIPTDAEWKALEMALGMTRQEADREAWRGTDQGTQLKEGGISGFKALLAGFRQTDGSFTDYNNGTFFWSSTQSGANNAWYRFLSAGDTAVYRSTIYYTKKNGLCVRCVKD